MSNPTQQQQTNNPFAILAETDDDDITVATSNCSSATRDRPTEMAMGSAQPFAISKDIAIADAGATGNFLQPGTPVKNLKPMKNPITISQPDGGQVDLHT